ncbi:ubiquinol-cytochrome C chaperone family protein [Pelagerythrobacter sp.]|uniref:ubiquinol-cytochrome C chaperone family protein n=1 Tax=Pelagerythrobacter sp. TaxID=2800702 RepID=UPI0035B00D6F
MSFLAKIFGRAPDPRADFVPLYHAVVALARQPEWYAECGVADTEEGRFDMLSAALSMVILRMEASEDLRPAASLLTELFVEDIEGQLRQQGIGDPTLGKRMGRLMSTLGGRIGAYRAGFARDDDGTLAEAAARNVTLTEHGDPACVAARLRRLHEALTALSDDALLAAEFAR